MTALGPTEPVLANRVEKVLLSPWWVLLMRWDEACAHATKYKLGWPLKPAMADSLAGWEAAMAAHGVVSLCTAIPGFDPQTYNDTSTAGKVCHA